MQHVAHGETLDGRHLTTLRLAAEHQAGADQLPVQVNRARAALALLARVLRAGQSHVLAEHREEALPLPHVLRHTRPAVDPAVDPHAAARYSFQAHTKLRRAITANPWRR